MQCDCLTKIRDNVKKYRQEKYPQETVKSVAIESSVFLDIDTGAFKSGIKSDITITYTKTLKDGREKEMETKIPAFHKYCPFCGVLIGEETAPQGL